MTCPGAVDRIVMEIAATRALRRCRDNRGGSKLDCWLLTRAIRRDAHDQTTAQRTRYHATGRLGLRDRIRVAFARGSS